MQGWLETVPMQESGSAHVALGLRPKLDPKSVSCFTRFVAVGFDD